MRKIPVKGIFMSICLKGKKNMIFQGHLKKPLSKKKVKTPKVAANALFKLLYKKV
jgi:hypothetical protein